MSILSDAAQFREAIAAVVREEIEKQTRDCFRVRKAVVTTAPSELTKLCGVQLIGDDQELFLPFSSFVSDLVVGNVAWVAIPFGSMRNAFVWETYDFRHSGGGGGGGGGGSVISVVDELDANGGTIRHINAVSLEGDTVVPSVLAAGYTAHNSQGEPIVGTASF